MIYTQKEIYEYLLNNPCGTNVHIGSLDDLNGEDYIFLSFTGETLIGSDDRGCYRTDISINIATKDFTRNKVLTKYVQDYLNVSVTYDNSTEFEYYLTRCECGVLMN